MTASGIPIAACASGVIFNNVQVEASGELINVAQPAGGVTVFVYVHQAGVTPTGNSTRVQVYSDEALTLPLQQPLTTDANGAIPGYVAVGQQIDLVASGGPLPAPVVLPLTTPLGAVLGGDAQGPQGTTVVQTVKGGKTPLTTDQVGTVVAAAGSGVLTFNSRPGAVTLIKGDVTATGLAAGDVGADASGAAAAAQAASDPIGTAASAVTAHIAAVDPHGDRGYAANLLATSLAGLAPAEAPAIAQGSGLTHSGVGQTIGGVVITAGMRVLDTATGIGSGLWVAASGAWGRPADFQTGSNAQGKLVDVAGGSLWLCISTAAVTVDTTSQVWTQLDASVIQAGTGLGKTGNTLNLALTKALITATGLAAADIGADAAGAAATEQTRALAAEALRAPLASPALTGTPTAPTQAALDASTKLATTAYADAATGVEKARALSIEAQLLSVATASNIPSSSLLQGMAAKPLMSTPPIFGARVTGLTTATEAANSTIPGSSAVKPNYASPRLDTTFRFNGPFNNLSANPAIDCGAFQATAPGGVGPTAMYGTTDYELVGQVFEVRMRDTGGTQYMTFWVSKNGGPFLAHVDPDVSMTLLSPGDGFYYLQPVNMRSRASYRIKIEGEAATFGGIRYNGTARTDAGATATSGVSTVTDAAVVASDVGRVVTGTNIPSGTIVGTVTPGTSFTLIDSAGNAVTTIGAVSGITMTADTLRSPSWTTSRLLGYGDSYFVGGGGPAARTDASASASGGVSTITDAAILATDINRPVSGTNIPANSYVGTVNPGVSFTLINGLGAAAVTAGAVSGITLAAVNQRTAAGYSVKLARQLGLDLHQSAYGGTGFTANTSGAGYKYGDPARIAGDVTPFFGPGDQPAAVLFHGSINDGLGGFAGTTQLATDFDALVSTNQAAYPNALIVAVHPMHPCRNNSSMNTNDATIAGQMDTIMAAHGLPVPLDPVSVIPLTGNGTVAAPTGVGNSDQNTAFDTLHPSPVGSTTLAGCVATYMRAQALTFSRAYAGAPNVPSSPVVASALSQAGSAMAAATALANQYKQARSVQCRFPAGTAAGTYVLTKQGPILVSAAGSADGSQAIYLAENAIAGYTLYGRASFTCDVSGSGTPGSQTVTCNFAQAGTMSNTVAGAIAAGANLGNTVTFTNPASQSKGGRTSGADFVWSDTNRYLFVVTLSAVVPTNIEYEISGELSWHNK